MRIDAVSDGLFALDGGAMFGVVPKPLWEKSHVADAANRITMTTRCLVVRDGRRTVLIDSGLGDLWNEKERAMYRHERRQGQLVEELIAIGVAPESVTDVIQTHLHFDHCGSLVTHDEGGVARLTFANARVHVQRQQFEWAKAPSPRDRASFRLGDFMPVAEAGRLVLHVGDVEIVPGFFAHVVSGHTPGLQAIRFCDGERTYLFASDLVPLHSQVRVPWVMGYDLNPLGTVREKEALLGRAADEGMVVVYQHDAEVAASTVVRDAKGQFAVGEKVTFA